MLLYTERANRFHDTARGIRLFFLTVKSAKRKNRQTERFIFAALFLCPKIASDLQRINHEARSKRALVLAKNVCFPFFVTLLHVWCVWESVHFTLITITKRQRVFLKTLQTLNTSITFQWTKEKMEKKKKQLLSNYSAINDVMFTWTKTKRKVPGAMWKCDSCPGTQHY